LPDKNGFRLCVDCCVWKDIGEPLNPENVPAPPEDEPRVWLEEPDVDSIFMGAKKALGAGWVCGVTVGCPKPNAGEAENCVEGGAAA
jgi:hypothetical protein